MADYYFLSVNIPDAFGKNLRHALRAPEDITPDLHHVPLPLACEGSMVFGRSRELVTAYELECKDCRKLAGL